MSELAKIPHLPDASKKADYNVKRYYEIYGGKYSTWPRSKKSKDYSNGYSKLSRRFSSTRDPATEVNKIILLTSEKKNK
jgi:hypothetical protein